MKASSFCARVSSSLLLTLFLSIAAFSQSTGLAGDLGHSFTKFDVTRIDRGGELRTEGANKTLSLRAAGKDYQLVVSPNDLRSSRYRAEDTNMIGVSNVPAPEVTTYKGKIAGDSNSEVRLTIDGVRVE